MSLVLIQEVGAGLATANTYALVADGDAYFLGHAYPSPWSPAPSPDNRDAALVMATRLIDAYCLFLGAKKSSSQALQWPRLGVPDRDADFAFFLRPGFISPPPFLSADTVPSCVVQATCEMARELLKVDRTAARAGEGVTLFISSGTQVTYDKHDKRPVLTETVKALLAPVLFAIPGGAMARLTRA
jgi:hypothetical protein